MNKIGGGLAAFRKFSLPSANTSKALYLQYIESFRLPFSAWIYGIFVMDISNEAHNFCPLPSYIL